MRIICVITWLLCFTWIAVARASGGEMTKREVGSPEVRLVHDLLNRAKEYGHRLARPVRNISDVIRIHFGLSLVQIMDFDEQNQILTINVWKHYKWTDEFQGWNKSEYGGVEKVILPADALWTPDIVLYDNMVKRDIEEHKEKLRLFSNGEIEWVPYVVYKSACSVDMSNFPFDTQHCSLKFGSWSHAAKELDLVFQNDVPDVIMDQNLKDIEWNIAGHRAERHVEEYNCCPPEDYVDLTFYLTLTRSWGFHLKFILFPTILLSILALVPFWIPPTRSDRSAMGTSLMSSYMLLMILVTSISPPANDINFVNYICAMIFMAFVIVLYSVAMVNVCNQTAPVPRRVKRLLESRFARCIICLPFLPNTTKKDPVIEAGGNHLLLEEIHANGDNQRSDKQRSDNGSSKKSIGQEKKPADLHQQDWLRFVKFVDCFVFTFCVIYMVVIFLVYFPMPGK